MTLTGALIIPINFGMNLFELLLDYILLQKNILDKNVEIPLSK